MPLYIKRSLINYVSFLIISIIGYIFTSHLDMTNYLQWAGCGVIISSVSVIINIFINFIFYKNDMIEISKKALHIINKK